MFLESHSFLDYLERGIDSNGNNNNLLDKLQDTIGRGQNPISILPTAVAETEITTISDPYVGILGKFEVSILLIMFPSNIRSEEQEEKRKQILAAARGAFGYIKHAPTYPCVCQVHGFSTSLYSNFHCVSLIPNCTIPNFSHILTSSPSAQVGKDCLSPMQRPAEKERMVSDIKVKLQGLWLRLLKLGATDDPLLSFEYGTILSLIESDVEWIDGSRFVECIKEHSILRFRFLTRVSLLILGLTITIIQNSKHSSMRQFIISAS
ncbi:hypothetical protein OIU76_005001 [Salix suchowensis]|nr:hypothetical protein OIU76_005001 [Salix suchowensis]